MLSFERSPARVGTFLRAAVAAGMAISVLVASACTVQPLYGSRPGIAGDPSITSELASIRVEQVTTRLAQEVRNDLVFLLSGGAGQPEKPAYILRLTVSSTVTIAALRQVGDENEPTSSLANVTGTFALVDLKKKKLVTNGSREITAPFDVPRQEFAALRARRDAENRAARELAELIRLAVAQGLSKPDVN